MFSGHDESAQNHAMLWSLIASAQRHEIDVQLYLRSVLAHLPGLSPEELPNYLPDVWKRDLMAQQQAKLNAHHAALARGIVK
jgi:sulfur relay (sulfurtransferase) complex TusBCD TusD component (DsrE family)